MVNRRPPENAWTPEEDQIIIDTAGMYIPDVKMRLKHKRTNAAIANRRSRLLKGSYPHAPLDTPRTDPAADYVERYGYNELTRDEATNFARPWTWRDVDDLESMLKAFHPLTEIALRLGRTYSGVAAKIQRLGWTHHNLP